MPDDNLDPMVKAALRKLFEEDVAFDKTLGIRVTSFAHQRPQVRFDMRPDLIGHPVRKVLHGGVIAAVLDATAGFAVMLAIIHAHADDPPAAQMQRFRTLGTIDLRVDFVRPGRGEHFIAGAQVLRLGSRVANVRMDLTNNEGELIAAGSAAFMVG